MKKILYIAVFGLSLYSLDANAFFASIDCGQLMIDVTNEMLELGYTGAESEAIASAAYGACLEITQG